jgi:hypothetical protein
MSIEDNNNLLFILHKYANYQDENFITESFVHLIQTLVKYEAKAAISIIKILTNGLLKLTDNDLDKISIKTQVLTELGVPDIEIRTHNSLVYIEIKVESDFGIKQINRYRDILKKSGLKCTCLTIITRYSYTFPKNEKPDNSIRWHQIIEIIENLNLTNEVSKYIKGQFIKFLKLRGLAMEKVTWELVKGLESFNNLIEMISEAISLNKLSFHAKSAGQNWYGFYIQNKQFFVGVYFDSPNLVRFNTEGQPLKIKGTNKIKLGYVERYFWFNDLELDSEHIHFFSRNKANQLQCLVKFIKESYEFAKTIV